MMNGYNKEAKERIYYFQRVEPDMENFLQKLRSKVKVALVGGSDLVKIKEQMGEDDGNTTGRNLLIS